jgi:hypothetical protein
MPAAVCGAGAADPLLAIMELWHGLRACVVCHNSMIGGRSRRSAV